MWFMVIHNLSCSLNAPQLTSVFCGYNFWGVQFVCGYNFWGYNFFTVYSSPPPSQIHFSLVDCSIFSLICACLISPFISPSSLLAKFTLIWVDICCSIFVYICWSTFVDICCSNHFSTSSFISASSLSSPSAFGTWNTHTHITHIICFHNFTFQV